MPFVIVRTRSSGAMVTIDAPQILLKALKSLCITKEDKELGYKPFKFSWIPPREAYRGGLQGKMENTHMSVRKILNTIEAYGWVLVSTHTFTDTGSEYVLQNNTQMASGCVLGGELQGIRKCSSFDELGADNVKLGGNNPSAPSPSTHSESHERIMTHCHSISSADSATHTEPLHS
ncbi:hypothetical protein SARC_02659 [Sphaeroforma arctica JP610]|uniref:Uncharacterized protein n=1 Tax=Sphaeroforma arctica JP610 TaxID=667725 RepID=A0A0L0G819_9EUKA|nr:hypothetical protein SARC_02659 [Sphaeroforma arctica JP610]KNC85135.1 hypothetical protein SARC_02659 [Sphaeroforma arctica JP610]|eukprot:XP_014159037.1 hypothetical protein SARC_02659 [Sphaeroforma arctica JP610]